MSYTYLAVNSYPHDSVITGYEAVTVDGTTINVPTGDRPFPASAFASLIASAFSDGILEGLTVTYSDGVATVAAGSALIGGKLVAVPNATEMALSAGKAVRLKIENGAASRVAYLSSTDDMGSGAETSTLILCSLDSSAGFLNYRGTTYCPLAENILAGNLQGQEKIITGTYTAHDQAQANTVFANLGYQPIKVEIYGAIESGKNGKLEIYRTGTSPNYGYSCQFIPNAGVSLSSMPVAYITTNANGLTINGSNIMYNYESQYRYVIYKSGVPAGEITTSTQSITIAATDWVNNNAVKSCPGVTSDAATNHVFLSVPASGMDAYVAAGIKCTQQSNGYLTFSCTTTPTAAITIGVLILS